MKTFKPKTDPYYQNKVYAHGGIMDNGKIYDRMRRNPAFDDDIWSKNQPPPNRWDERKVDAALLRIKYKDEQLAEVAYCRYCDSMGFNVPRGVRICPPCWRKHERELWRKSTARYRARHRDKLPNECSHCNEPMASQHKTKKYCSARCRVAANRAASL